MAARRPAATATGHAFGPTANDIASDAFERRRTIRTYDLAREGFDDLPTAQEDRCAVCRQLFVDTPHVDHCHRTSRVRGLLCRSCNTRVGLPGDDAERLRRAIAYLERGE